MALKDLVKSTLRVAIAIFLALLALAAAVAVYSHMKEIREQEAAKPYEEVKHWQYDLKDRIGMGVHARTKLISGQLLVSIDISGYPKYLTNWRNQSGSLNFEFLDKDGFKLLTHAVKISEFTTTVDKNGENIGLQHQYEEHLDLERYRQISQMQVGWNLVTTPEPFIDPAAAKPILDHCAPNISKAERLKRLAQHGSVREAGIGEYTAGGHSVTFATYDSTLLNCR